MNKKKNDVKRMLAGVVKIVLAFVVMAFLGLKSYDFFLFTTPADESYYALLGFGLTGGGLIAYLYLFKYDANTPIQRTVSIIMLVICGLGEIATAGFGMQVEAWKSAGYELNAESFRAMVWVVQILGLAHAVALIAWFAGDSLTKALSDDDGDGIPNAFDKDYKSAKQLTRQFAQEDENPTPPPSQKEK